MSEKRAEAPSDHVRYFQFRLRTALFEALRAEVTRRQNAGEKASINQVGQEWMEKGRHADTEEETIP